jgi:hypothetical protein
MKQAPRTLQAGMVSIGGLFEPLSAPFHAC